VRRRVGWHGGEETAEKRRKIENIENRDIKKRIGKKGRARRAEKEENGAPCGRARGRWSQRKKARVITANCGSWPASGGEVVKGILADLFLLTRNHGCCISVGT
jgi:hypothetical protein